LLDGQINREEMFPFLFKNKDLMTLKVFLSAGIAGLTFALAIATLVVDFIVLYGSTTLTPFASNILYLPLRQGGIFNLTVNVFAFITPVFESLSDSLN